MSAIEERICEEIGAAIEKRHGTYEDALELFEDWQRLRGERLREVCEAHERGEHERAEQLYASLEPAWGRPLADVGQEQKHEPSTDDALRTIRDAAPEILRRIHAERAGE